jgi:glycosyltransferase involved in cell wall biosynthesis
VAGIGKTFHFQGECSLGYQIAAKEVSKVNPKISAIVITKNESAKIADCLESLQWVDEIIIVDDYSTDATKEICQRYNVRFYQRQFTGFKDQKSFAMSLTSHDWILELDADERVSDTMRQSILNLRETDSAACSCFEFRRLTRFWGKWLRHGSFYPDYKGRLYNKLRGTWSERNIHERFIPHGSVKRLPGDILHFQDLDVCSFILRSARYADLSAQEYYRQGRIAKWHHFTIRPLYTFIYRFFLRLGILDGIQGFVISVTGAIGTFIKYMKLYELQKSECLSCQKDERSMTETSE